MGVVGWEETAGESLVGVSITENLKAGGGSDDGDATGI